VDRSAARYDAVRVPVAAAGGFMRLTLVNDD
jgi:hypothetical protein